MYPVSYSPIRTASHRWGINQFGMIRSVPYRAYPLIVAFFQGSFVQFEHILADSVCNNLVKAALRRIELFVAGRAMLFNS